MTLACPILPIEYDFRAIWCSLYEALLLELHHSLPCLHYLTSLRRVHQIEVNVLQPHPMVNGSVTEFYRECMHHFTIVSFLLATCLFSLFHVMCPTPAINKSCKIMPLSDIGLAFVVIKISSLGMPLFLTAFPTSSSFLNKI